MKDFKILKNWNKELLEEQVRALLKDGWEVKNTDFVFDVAEGHPVFMISLTKDNEETLLG